MLILTLGVNVILKALFERMKEKKWMYRKVDKGKYEATLQHAFDQIENLLTISQENKNSMFRLHKS